MAALKKFDPYSLRLPLSVVLSYEAICKNFTRFVKKEHSDESLSFLTDVEKLRLHVLSDTAREKREAYVEKRKRLQTKKLVVSCLSKGSYEGSSTHGDVLSMPMAVVREDAKIDQLARQIFDKYKPSAEMSVSWPPGEFERVSKHLAEHKVVQDPLLFDVLRDNIMASMSADQLPRFYASPFYKVSIDHCLHDLCDALTGGSVALKQLENGLENANAALLSAGYRIFDANPVGFQIIYGYSKTEYSDESFDFVQAVRDYRIEIASAEKRNEAAHALHKQFLTPQSPQEVTYPASLKPALMEGLAEKTIRPGVFDEVLAVVEGTIRTDIFRRFVASPMFHSVLALIIETYKLKESVRELSKSFQPSVRMLSQMKMSRIGPRAHAQLKQDLKEKKIPDLPVVELQAVVRDGVLMRAYTAFCKKEHSEENVLFWNAARAYRRTCQKAGTPLATAQKMANDIYQSFLKSGAHMEVSVSKAVLQSIEKGLESDKVDPELFNGAEKVVYKVMSDSCSRFCTSQEYATAVTDNTKLKTQGTAKSGCGFFCG